VQAKITLTPDGTIRIDDVIAHGSTGTVSMHGYAHLNGFALTEAKASIRIPKNDPLPVDARSLYGNTNAVIGVRSGNHSKIAAFWAQVRDGYRLPAELVEVLPFDEVVAAHTARSDGRSGHIVLSTGLEPPPPTL
jgi:hypothetical protein